MAVILSTEPLSPRRGGVDVWRIDLGDETLDGLGELLCEGERARGARLIRERDRLLWTRSRGALRMLLGRYVARDPRQLRFEFGPHGKPRLADRAGEPRRRGPAGLSFNLSHSGELMLLAVTARAEVGVDVERARERYEAGFLKEWTKREATVKCLGTGLARTRIDLDGDLNAIDFDGKDAPWTAELDVGEGAFGAVAVAGGPCELRLRRFAS
jgi:4'-phosphopantetheinyl transferase